MQFIICIATVLMLIIAFDTWRSEKDVDENLIGAAISHPSPPDSDREDEIAPPKQDKETPLASFVCQPIDTVQQKIGTTDNIEGASERNKYYPDLARQAICNEKFDLAYETTKKISKNAIRDESLLLLVKELSKKGHVALANRAKERIKDYEVRNKATKIIGKALL